MPWWLSLASAADEAMLGQSPAIFARSVGTGDRVIVLLHGGPGAGSAHLRSMEDLVADGYRVVTYDQRGTGASEMPPDPRDFGFEAYVRDLELVRAWTGADQVTLLGHSWGGLAAMAYTAAAPEHVERLILVDSTASNETSQDEESDAVRAAEARLEIPPPPPDLPPGCASWWPGLYAYYFDPTRIRVEDLPHQCTDEVAHRTWAAIGRYDLSGAMRDVHVPTLIVFGAADPLRVSADDIAADLAPSAPRTVILPRCGHRPMFECKPALYAAIRAFRDARPREEAFEAWIRSEGAVLARAGALRPRSPGDAVALTAEVCHEGRRSLLFELGDGARWTARGDEPCAPAPTTATSDLADRWTLQRGEQRVTLAFHEGTPYEARPCAPPWPAYCPAPGDVELWNGHGTPVLTALSPVAVPAGRSGTSDVTVGSEPPPSATVLAFPGFDGYDLLVRTPVRDAVPRRIPRIEHLDRFDHLEIALAGRAVAIVADAKGYVGTMDLATGAPVAGLTAAPVADGWRVHVDAALGTAITVAFSDGDGRRRIARLATLPWDGDRPSSLGRVVDPAERWRPPAWVTRVDPEVP